MTFDWRLFLASSCREATHVPHAVSFCMLCSVTERTAGFRDRVEFPSLVTAQETLVDLAVRCRLQDDVHVEPEWRAVVWSPGL